MIDRSHIGDALSPYSVAVDEGLVRLFLKAIAGNDPIYHDVDAARAAGFPAIPVPPTYAYCLSLQVEDSFADNARLGVSRGQVLHGEQSFAYRGDIFVGDTITFQEKIADIYEEKNGALEFVVRDFDLRNQFGELVCEMRSTIAVVNAKR